MIELEESDDESGSVLGPILRWYRRPTLRALKLRAEQSVTRFRRSDDRQNEEWRLPSTESVHLGGLVLAEAFTPSTVSALYRTLENWPGERAERRDELVERLTRSRRGGGGAWQQLGLVRRPGAFIARDGHHDPDLPDGVEAVWLHLAYPMPSLAVVVATFTLSEQAGDLSTLLRADYQTQLRDVQIRVHGWGARWRAKFPWARPARHGVSSTISRPEMEKHDACVEVIGRYERECLRWFAKRFPGRFSLLDQAERPVVRLMLTTEQIPFCGRPRWFGPVGLDYGVEVWRSTEDLPGWALSFGQELGRHQRPVITVAARRQDAADGSVGGGDDGTSNWHLTQLFNDGQASLVALLSMRSLLSVYSDRLGDFRDRAAKKHRIQLPVRQALEMDRHLIGDGLDALTVAADIRVLTDDQQLFSRYVPDYVEDLSDYPEGARPKRAPEELAASLQSALREQATRLAEDMETTTGNIRASAELRQVITNTRLQRAAIVLSVVALVVAILSLIYD